MKKKILSLLLAAMMVVGLFPVTAIALQGGGVPYLDASGAKQNCTSPVTITSDMTAWGTESTDTWYLASGTVSIGSRVIVSGNVNLILEDGAALTAAGITVQGSNSLTVYCQTLGTGVLTSNGGVQDAGIGGYSTTAGSITINGGTVNAAGGEWGAGIGGGTGKQGGTVVINGGTVNATGGRCGAGIGGGNGGDGGTVTINGGVVNATGNGGGAGIGGGDSASTGGDGGNVTINGGLVTVKGSNASAGIGAGNGKTGQGSLTISSGATVRSSTALDGTLSTTTITDYTSSRSVYVVIDAPYQVSADYLDSYGTLQQANAYPLSSFSTELSSGWYVVNSDITISDRITVTGDVKLILADGWTLTAEKGIAVESSNSLTVYGQENGTGKLIADGETTAGIGGDMSSGTVKIYGGDIEATGNLGGIRCSDLSIYGGKVVAYTTSGVSAFPVNSLYVSSALMFKAGSSAGDAVAISNSGYGTQTYAAIGPDPWKLLQNAVAGTGSSADGEFTVTTDSTSGTITVALENDIACANQSAGALTVPAGKTVILRLNGHKIDRAVGSTAIADGYAIRVAAGGNLTIYDNDTGIVTGGNSTNSGGGVYVESGAALVLLGGAAISGNKALYGGGIYNAGTVTVTYGTISDNEATFGGGIYNVGFVGFTSGTISECTASGNGGAVYVGGSGRFETSGGTIQDCTAGYGGAVYVVSGGVATFANNIAVSGCTAAYGGGIYSAGVVGLETSSVSGCSAESAGGGIYVADGGSIFLGKTANVTGNTVDSAANNLFLIDGATATLGTGADVPAPASGMSIGVSMAAPGTFTSNVGTGYASYFTSDDSEYSVLYTAEQKLTLAKTYTVTVDSGITNGTVEADKTAAAAGDTVTLTVTPDSGYELSILSYNDGSDHDITEDESFTMPAANVTVTAEFTVIKVAPTVTLPTARTGLACSGEPQSLINAGTSGDVDFEYALGADAVTAPTSGWNSSVPEGTDAGTYYVWYRAEENTNYTGVAPACITVTVSDPSHSHVWADGWTNDENGHWHECTAADCDITDYSICGETGAAYGSHDWTNENGICAICAYECSHDWTNGDGICAICGYECDHDGAADGTCPICGKELSSGEVIAEAEGMIAAENISGLEEFADTQEAASGETVRVVLKVESTPVEDAEGAEEIEALTTANQQTEYLDITIRKISSTGSSVPVTDTQTNIIELKIPFVTANRLVQVYRYHGGTAEAMTENPAAGAEGFRVGSGYVTICASKFSTYAIAYEELSYLPPLTPAPTPAEEPAEEPAESVCPMDATCPVVQFTDTAIDAWWHDGIHYCVENGIMNGFPDMTFNPNGDITRAQIVTMLWRLDGERYANYLMSFEDVAAEQWYTEAVRWAAAEKIVEGYDTEHFGPNDPITREQLATILYRYAQYKGQGFKGAWMFLLDFTDRADISEWADEAVHWCSMKGIVTGKDGKMFDPQGSATRAEAAAMVQRFCGAIEK